MNCQEQSQCYSHYPHSKGVQDFSESTMSSSPVHKIAQTTTVPVMHNQQKLFWAILLNNFLAQADT